MFDTNMHSRGCGYSCHICKALSQASDLNSKLARPDFAEVDLVDLLSAQPRKMQYLDAVLHVLPARLMGMSQTALEAFLSHSLTLALSVP